MSSPPRHFYEFGPFRLDASERVLLKDGATVGLTPKETELLAALVRRAGRVVPKEELLREVWAETFVAEKTLAQNVFTLRKALAREDAEGQYVETIPRRGYRFCAPVREVIEDEGPEAPGVEGVIHVTAGGRRVEGGAGVAPRLTPGAAPAVAETFAGEARVGANGDSTTGAGSPASEGRAADSTAIHTTSEIHATVDAPAALHESARPGHPVRDAVLITLAAVLAMAGLVFVVFKLAVRPRTERRTPPAFQSMKVTRLPVQGQVLEAAISPDGKYLAYVAPEPDGRGMSVHVRQVSAAGNARRIVEPEEAVFYGGLGFSPDGEHVHFTTFRPNVPPQVREVPAFGGAVRTLIEGVSSPVSFSPDGKRIAYMRGQSQEGGSVALYVADAGGANERKLAEKQFPALFGLPRWSPDGRALAVAYGSGQKVDSGVPYIGLAVLNVADGLETPLTPERWVGFERLEWTPDGAALVVNASEQELSPSQLWEVSYPSGEVRRITNDLSSYVGASLTADGKALVAVQTDRNPNVWVAPNGDAARARQITSGTGRFDGFYGVSWTPDGRIVYASIASGSWDIWMMNADGTGQKQLTVGTRSNYGPSVSPDGRYIVFLSNRAGSFNIWRMNLDGSNQVQLTRGAGENFPHVTPDGRSVVYATYGFHQPGGIWKIPIEGGEPVRLTDKPASWPFVSPDGKFVAATYSPDPAGPGKLAVIPIEGGEPVKLFDIEPSFRANVTWTPDNRGLAFLDARTGTNNVWMQPLSGGRAVQLTDFKGEGVIAYDYSRDGRQLVATRSAETTGVVLIRDFR
jgi:Tol biopolymer transport system component/DNA-binding winged helix-turn-helix (wHTH) protein